MKSKSLREQREELRITQQEVAVILGVTRVTYNKWENDTDKMPLGKYNHITAVFEQLRALKEGKRGLE